MWCPMCNRNVPVVLLAVVALCSQACGPTFAPPSARRRLEQMQDNFLGSWTEVTLGGAGNGTKKISGELIAINEGAVDVNSPPTLWHVPLGCASQIRVAAFEAPTGGVVAGGLAGTASTLSHGFFLIFSAPIWLLTTTITAVNYNGTGEFTARRGDTKKTYELRKFARFPQGVPAGFREQAARQHTFNAACRKVDVAAVPYEPPASAH